MRIRPNIAATVAVVLLSSSCYSTTRVYSNPSGATVVLDETKNLGTTPLEVEDQVWLWTKHSVTVQKDGYESQTIELKNEGLNLGYLALCVCTLGLLLPIMFASEFPTQYVVQLSAATPQSGSEPLDEQATVTFSE